MDPPRASYAIWMTHCMRKHIPVARPSLVGDEGRYLAECIESGWISSAGSFIDRFEQAVADSCGVCHGVACSSGTTALHLALRAVGVQAGDEVLVPTLTFVATANAVAYCGATPVFVDCLEDSYNMNPAKLEEAITDKTRGIIAVHLFGWPAEMDEIRAIAEARGLFVIEDAAEALGALYRGRHAGALGHAATFSFYGNKMITTGEGGMVVTDVDEIAEESRLLRGQGMDPNRRYWFGRVGYNYRLTNMQAAVGLGQIECLSRHLAKRQEIAASYNSLLAGMEEHFQTPKPPAHVQHAYWMFVVTLQNRRDLDRDRIAEIMEEAGVETRPVFYPMHQLPPYYEPSQSFPVAEAVSQRGLVLPTHGSMTNEDLEYVVETLEAACRKSIAESSRVAT